MLWFDSLLTKAHAEQNTPLTEVFHQEQGQRLVKVRNLNEINQRFSKTRP